MPGNLMLALPLLVTLLAGQTCTTPAKLQRPPAVTVRGDSLSLNVCVGGGALPYATVASTFASSNNGGWLFKNGAVSGETALQIKNRYLTEEATACNGERCALLVVEGGVNSLRAGTTPAATIADMVAIVDDGLTKGYNVLWLDVTPYAGFAGAGTNPLGQATSYNALMATACTARASNPRLRCLFNYSTFVNPSQDGFLLPAYSCDGVHYSQAGMDLLASRVAAQLLLLRAVP